MENKKICLSCKRIYEEFEMLCPYCNDWRYKIINVVGQDTNPTALPKDTMLLDRYRISEKIPKGNRADLYLCDDTKKKESKVVAKVYREEMVPDEQIRKKLKGPRKEGIISFLDYGEINGRFFEVMEYAKGGSLEEKIEKRKIDKIDQPYFDETELTSEVLPKINKGLIYCHENGIIHRDIKESNIYCRDVCKDVGLTDIVIGDFGISLLLLDGQSERFVKRKGHGTIEYLAPEGFTPNNSPDESVVNKEMDYYALGITLIRLTGVNPFEGINEINRQFYIKIAGKVPLPEDISKRFAKLLKGLLHPTPRHRWGAEEINQWLNGENVPLIPVEKKFYYKIGDKKVYSLPELAKLMLDNPVAAKKDITRKAILKAVDRYDTNIGRELNEIFNKHKSVENSFLEIIYTLNPDLPYRLFPEIDANSPKTPIDANSPEKLAKIIDENEETWKEGKKQLFDGRIPIWLKAKGNGDQLKELKEWDSHREEFEKNRDAGLEGFLRILNKDISAPSIEVSKSSIRVRLSGDKLQKSVSIEVSNPGRGHLHGTIRLKSNNKDPIGKISQEKIDLGPDSEKSTAINLNIDMKDLTRGKTYRSELVLNTNVKKVSIPIKCRVGFPLLAVLWNCLTFGAIGTMIAVIIRGMVIMIGYPDWLSTYFGHYLNFDEASSGKGIFFVDLNEFIVPFISFLVLIFYLGVRIINSGRN